MAGGWVGGDDAAVGGAGDAVEGQRIVMRVRLSVKLPLRFELRQDSEAMAVSHEVVERETASARPFTKVLEGSCSDEEAYAVEVAGLDSADDVLLLRSALAARLSQSDRLRYSPSICRDDGRWILRVGATGDPEAVHKLREELARAGAGMEHSVIPTTVILRPKVIERVHLKASHEPYEVRAGDRPGELVLAAPSGELVSFLGEGVRVVPRDPLDMAFNLGGVWYKGELQITRKDSWDGRVELVATNRIDIECYVEGVLAGEVYPNWELEALKAQAVAARTYALYRKAGSCGREYDVDDTVAYQRYSGGHYVESFSKAVAQTRGEVITYGGRLAKAHYFASSGGMTEGDEEIWLGGGDEPYLEPVADFDQSCPHYVWQNLPALWAADFLAKLGLQPGFPAWIEPALALDGKILSYRFRTPSDSLTLTREQVRHKLGLKSPRFTLRLVGSEETGVSLAAMSGSPRDEVTGVRDAGARPALPDVRQCVPLRSGGLTTGYRVTLEKGVTVKGNAVEAASARQLSPETLVIVDGRGYGHGVGLSQWGAQGMATMRNEAGEPAYDYVAILKHYYTGVDVADGYGLRSAGAVVGFDAASGLEIAPRASGPEQAGELEPSQPLTCD
jgi:stage II sporulation protein D